MRTDWRTDVATRSTAPKAYFTVEQANRSLVLVRRIVSDVIREYAQLLELEDIVEAAERSGQPEPLEIARQRLVSTVDSLQTCLEELDQLGVELKDFSRGIVDFPSRLDGRAVCLCWLHGEQDVSHWHETNEGFACRQPLALMSPPALFTPNA